MSRVIILVVEDYVVEEGKSRKFLSLRDSVFLKQLQYVEYALQKLT